MSEYISDELREKAKGHHLDLDLGLLDEAADAIELRDLLLEAMQAFIGDEHREAFEETLDPDVRDLYREHFDLDDGRDRYQEYDEMMGEDGDYPEDD